MQEFKFSICALRNIVIPALLLIASSAVARENAKKVLRIPVHVVIVTTFQEGPDSGPNAVGELTRWVTNFALPDIIEFPQGYRHLRYNPRKKVLGLVTGMGPLRAASSITALGSDPRFDLRNTYWVVAAIAGIDPNRASVGCAAWAKFVVDGDQAYEIDAREIPSNWSTGYIPTGRNEPFQPPVPMPGSTVPNQLFPLNPSLVNWAFELTKGINLPDDANLRKVRARYVGYPNALKPPFVMIGDTLSAGTFWLGGRFNAWAEGWVNYFTMGAGNFVTSAEEDAGVMQALTFLSQAGKADLKRVLILRTASDYVMPPPGETVATFLKREATADGLSGFDEALNAAYIVAGPVVEEISRNWRRYQKQPP
jgi:purine nucleoside permease